MTKFRPCIDLHNGKVKQIVGESLTKSIDNNSSDNKASTLITNFTSDKDSTYFSKKFKKDKLTGGHVIMLGRNKNNENAAINALKEYPNGFQVGGGITIKNSDEEKFAKKILDLGASHLIITSYLFDKKGNYLHDNLVKMAKIFGSNKLVVDLSCKKSNQNQDDDWYVYKDFWKTKTTLKVNEKNLEKIMSHCDELLIHSVAYEGLQGGFDHNLVVFLSKIVKHLGKKITYAGGIKSMNDIYLIDKLSSGNIDLTVGSALDIFGGKFVNYKDCVEFNLRKI